MSDLAAVSSGDAVAFMISGGLVYEIIAAACSSPQTTEINADTRCETLFKWVYLGLAQATVFVAAAAWIAQTTGGNPRAVIAGGVLGGGLMFASYWHARDAGLKSKAPGTEY